MNIDISKEELIEIVEALTYRMYHVEVNDELFISLLADLEQLIKEA